MPLQIPHPSNPLHLYRHLLRESTYLPPLCRPWIASRIQQRFRDCRQRNPPEPYIKEAHASLRFLRSANAGHVARLERLCLMATGRVGKRRRILATSQLKHRPPADSAELERSRVGVTALGATDAAAPPSDHHDWLDNWSLDMVNALAKSQVSQQAKDWPQTMRRLLDTKHILEGRNSFGRLYKPKLVRNKLKKHWASVLKQLMPPLPKGEWDKLAALASGDADEGELRIPPRRPVARPAQGSTQDSNPSPASEPWDWSQHALKPARVIERGNSRRHKTLTGREDQDPRGHGRPIGIRIMSPRKLQRIYSRIWTMSPVMKQNPQSQKWSVSWGKSEQKISAPSKRDLVFFQGVTNKGQALPKAEPSSKG